MDNLEEMDKFLKKYNISRLNWGEIENFNRPNIERTDAEAETPVFWPPDAKS